MTLLQKVRTNFPFPECMLTLKAYVYRKKKMPKGQLCGFGALAIQALLLPAKLFLRVLLWGTPAATPRRHSSSQWKDPWWGQLPCGWPMMEVDPPAPIQPSGDCGLGWHLDSWMTLSQNHTAKQLPNPWPQKLCYNLLYSTVIYSRYMNMYIFVLYSTNIYIYLLYR